jgi:hypothetical protein
MVNMKGEKCSLKVTIWGEGGREGERLRGLGNFGENIIDHFPGWFLFISCPRCDAYSTKCVLFYL